jgi:hypothetical protein
MKTTWIVRWRGTEESYPNPQDALDRWDQLDAWGIKAELLDAASGRSAGAAWITRGWHPPARLTPTAQAA